MPDSERCPDCGGVIDHRTPSGRVPPACEACLIEVAKTESRHGPERIEALLDHIATANAG